MCLKPWPRARRILLFTAALLTALSPASGWAVTCGTALSPLTISATGVNFGSYDPVSESATEATGNIVVACDLSVDVLPAFVVRLSSGAASQFNPRTMISGPSTLAYNLFTSASRTSIWGDGSNDTDTVTNEGLLVLDHVEFTIHGAVAPRQFVKSDAYADTIIVTIEY